ncbi:MAG: hypothetical protein NVS9B3_11270 [Gemmatimonadaceae bacterium]
MLIAKRVCARIVGMTTRPSPIALAPESGRPRLPIATAAHRSHALRHPLRARPRRGLTLAELLVAVVLFDIGVLSLLSVAATVTRAVGEGGNATLAARAVEGRVETLAALRCDRVATSGGGWREGVSGNVTERWTVYDTAGSVIVRDTVAVRTVRGATRHGFVTALSCRLAT